MLNNRLLGKKLMNSLSKYSLNVERPFLKNKALSSNEQISCYASTNCARLKVGSLSYSLLRQGKLDLGLLKRAHSTLLQFDNDKIENYLKNLNEELLKSQFNFSKEQPIFDLLKDKTLYEENLQQTKELKDSLDQLKSLKEREGV